MITVEKFYFESDKPAIIGGVNINRDEWSLDFVPTDSDAPVSLVLKIRGRENFIALLAEIQASGAAILESATKHAAVDPHGPVPKADA